MELQESTQPKLESIYHIDYSYLTREHLKYIPYSVIKENTDVFGDILREMDEVEEPSMLVKKSFILHEDYSYMMFLPFVEVFALKTGNETLVRTVSLWEEFVHLAIKQNMDKENSSKEKTRPRDLVTVVIGLLEEVTYDSIKNKSHLDNTENYKHIYIARNKTENTYKIGMSKYIEKRISDIQVSNSEEIELVYFSPKIFDKYKKIEDALHNKYEEKHICGEWFNLSETDIEDIKEILDTCTTVIEEKSATIVLKTIEEYKDGKVYKYLSNVTNVEEILEKINS